MEVRLPVVGIQMNRNGEVLERLLVVLQVQVALAAMHARIGLAHRIVLDELGEVNDRIVPIP